mmetsp:Transcript_5783/g.18403  ORF Transcript_5783/g.18403 Transcript_5783/m.18403 type:complete len:244 (-) Transcript_5783:54-785(-)
MFCARSRLVVGRSPLLARGLLTLNNLKPMEGSMKKAKRVGRGRASGLGKTSGRGHKGKHARAGGKVRPGFEGGQTPLYRRLPKFGFNNAAFRREMKPLNLDKLQQWIDEGRIDASQPITLKTLHDSNIVGKVKEGIKLLGTGSESFTAKVDIEVSQVSKSAIEAVERNGGSVTSVYLNRLGLRATLHPEKFEVLPRLARPKPKDMPYYLSYEHRGYLSTEMQLRKHGLEHLLGKLGVEGTSAC